MRIFFLTAVLGGVGAAVGSFIGRGFGGKGLYAGAVVGGMIAVAFAVWLALKLAWIERRNFRPALVGGEIGFLVAAPVVVQILASPIGPILSTIVIGAGALVGSRVVKEEQDNGVNPQA